MQQPPVQQSSPASPPEHVGKHKPGWCFPGMLPVAQTPGSSRLIRGEHRFGYEDGHEPGYVEVEEGELVWNGGSDGWFSPWRKARGFVEGRGELQP